MRGALEIRITRDDVGRRVTVRRRLPPEPGGPSTTDTVGRLVSWSDDDVLTVVRRDETGVTIPLGEVLAAKVIPEPPPRRRTAGPVRSAEDRPTVEGP
jgi:hypothetical protein